MIARFAGQWQPLSNFHLQTTPIKDKFGIEYYSVENIFQACKTQDPDLRLAMSKMTPGQSKRAGRAIKMTPEQIQEWDSKCYEAMKACVREKFKDPQLANFLLSTGDEDLQEGNVWHDNRWGVCNCARCPGQGANWLGKILMEIRSEIGTNAHRN